MRKIIIAASIGLACASGCSIFRDPCVATAASRATAIALVADAQLALDQAEVAIAAIPNAEIRRSAWIALDGAGAKLRSATAALAGIQGACEAVDARAVFAQFVEAWRVLAPYLALLGGPGETVVTPPVVAQ